MTTIGIIDYGAGNLGSVLKSIEYAGANVVRVSQPEQIAAVDKIILPGVGASGHAMQKLQESQMDQAMSEAVHKQGKPFLGICVGMQLLASDLYEFGHHKGLGWIEGDVVSLKDRGVKNLPVPNMGWSDVVFAENLKSLDSHLGRHKAFYFCHSFTMVPKDAQQTQASIEYDGVAVTAGIAMNNIYGFQFHPEKSQVAGDLLMQWFADLNI